MSKDKCPSLFSPQMEAIVFIILEIYFATRALFKFGEYIIIIHRSGGVVDIYLTASRLGKYPPLSPSDIEVNNRPFAGSSHMVRNKLHWDANNAVGLSKQRNSFQSSPTFFCFESPTASFASHCNLFRTM